MGKGITVEPQVQAILNGVIVNSGIPLAAENEIMKNAAAQAQQEQQAQQQQAEAADLQHVVEDANLKLLYSKATDNIALARERTARAESNLGLFEERLSMIGKNRSMAIKDKVDALSKLIETVTLYGDESVSNQEQEIESMDNRQVFDEDMEKREAKRATEANKFLTEIMGNMNNQGQQEAPQMAQME